MSLPFEPSETRQYVCFVCGVSFGAYNEYREHIVASHEEGREYVLCPLSRCKAPVRDVRLHFKVKHPGEQCPNAGQMRALIWTDQRNPKKRKKPKFKEGSLISLKNGGKKMHYRSGYEKTVYECLEVMDEVAAYQVEGFRVSYFYNGRERGYYPDLLVHFADNRFEVWEVKPENQTQLPINLAKWSACREHCLARGWGFVVVNEHVIDKMKRRLKDKLLVENHKRNEKS
jgi:hypothetical protein